MFERILIPLDGSPRAELIVTQVGRLLKREDSEILLLRSVDVPTPDAARVHLGRLRREGREEAQRYLHDLARRFAASGAKVHGRVVEGPPAETILEAARTEGATMIAMSTHGRSGVARWVMGSVAEKVIRASTLPVLLVRSFRRSAHGDLEPMSPQELPFRRILVPTDGSAESMAVVGPAKDFGLLFGSQVVLLHVQPPLFPPAAVYPGMEGPFIPQPPPPPPEKDPATSRMAERFAQAGLKVTRVTTVGDPAAEIVDHSHASGVDLIAMATHGRSGISRWMLGSVTERVLRSAGVPLLIVRATKSGGKAKK